VQFSSEAPEVQKLAKTSGFSPDVLHPKVTDKMEGLRQSIMDAKAKGGGVSSAMRTEDSAAMLHALRKTGQKVQVGDKSKKLRRRSTVKMSKEQIIQAKRSGTWGKEDDDSFAYPDEDILSVPIKKVFQDYRDSMADPLVKLRAEGKFVPFAADADRLRARNDLVLRSALRDRCAFYRGLKSRAKNID
jgi:hypothetical protein